MADFPINAVARRAQYVVGSSGQAGPYAFSFPILDDDDIAVYVGSTLKTKTTHYTVTRSLATGTGSITFVGGQEPVENDLVTLISAQALARTSDYTSGGDLQASSLNDDLDRLTIGQQQIAETLDRSVQLPLFTSRDTSSLGAGPLLFPYDATPANQANKVIGYDAAGTSLVALTPNSGTLITTPGSATDNAIVRFDGTTGTGFQNSPVTIDDAGAVAGVTTLNGTAVTALLDTADIGVTVQGYDADTMKSDTAARLSANMGFTPVTDTSSSGAVTFDFATGNIAKITLSENITSITLSNAAAGDVLEIWITQAAGGYTVTGWPAAVKWSGGGTAYTASTTNGAVDIIMLRYDGTNYFGSYQTDHQ